MITIRKADEAGQAIDHQLHADRYAWLQLARGSLELNGENLRAGDGAAISKESRIEISAAEDSEFLRFVSLEIHTLQLAPERDTQR